MKSMLNRARCPMHRACPHLRIAVTAAALLTAATLPAACTSEGTADVAPATSSTTTVSETTTAPEAATTTAPEPITTEEKEWVGTLHRLKKRLQKTVFQGGVVTQARLLSDARIYAGCAKSLGSPPSARFARAHGTAKTACRQFRKAAAQLRTAAANVDASGAVVAGTPQEDAFNRAFERGNAYAGNALNKISKAVTRAEAIRDALPAS
jgi:hypothetical protein